MEGTIRGYDRGDDRLALAALEIGRLAVSHAFARLRGDRTGHAVTTPDRPEAEQDDKDEHDRDEDPLDPGESLRGDDLVAVGEAVDAASAAAAEHRRDRGGGREPKEPGEEEPSTVRSNRRDDTTDTAQEQAEVDGTERDGPPRGEHTKLETVTERVVWVVVLTVVLRHEPRRDGALDDAEEDQQAEHD